MVHKETIIQIALSVILLVSCSKELPPIYVDNYFSDMYNIDEKLVQIVGVQEFMGMKLPETDITISPLLYNFKRDFFKNYPHNVLVLGEVNKTVNEKHNYIEFSTLAAYEELIGNLMSSETLIDVKKISVIIDNFDDLDSEEIKKIETLNEKYEFRILKVRKGVSKSSIKRFLDRNKDTNLWLIDSVKYSMYAYENIEKGKIIIRHGKILQRNNQDVIFSIERDYTTILDKISEFETYLIEEDLKKY